MNENESINFNNYNNQTYIKTNKDDINSLEKLKSTMQTGINDNNNYLNSNFNLFSPFGMAGMYMMGGQNTFFDKLFMTLERANYQMYHLCEVINMIENQKQTLKYVYFLLKQIYKTILQKYYSILENLKQYLFSLKDIFTKNNSLFTINELNNHIQILNFLIKVIISLCIIKLFIN